MWPLATCISSTHWTPRLPSLVFFLYTTIAYLCSRAHSTTSKFDDLSSWDWEQQPSLSGQDTPRLTLRTYVRSKASCLNTGPFQTRQTQWTNQPCPIPNNNSRIVPMEVDATNIQNCEPFKKLTKDECKQLQKEGKCFRCHQKGHMAHECLGRSQTSSHTPSTVSACTTMTTDSTTTVKVTPDHSVSNAPVVCTTTVKVKLTHAQQIAVLEEEMSDEECSTYLDSCDMETDFYSVELWQPQVWW